MGREVDRLDLAQVQLLHSLAGGGSINVADETSVDRDIFSVDVEVQAGCDFGDVGAVDGRVEGFGEVGEEDAEDELRGERVWTGRCEGVEGGNVCLRGVVHGEEDALVCREIFEGSGCRRGHRVCGCRVFVMRRF